MLTTAAVWIFDVYFAVFFLDNITNKDSKRSEFFMQLESKTPSYAQVNITIPQSTSPQLDSKGSSPRSDYSSQSSTSSKPYSLDIARDKIISELRIKTENGINGGAETPLQHSSPIYSQVIKPQTKEFTSYQPDLKLPDNLTFANQKDALTEQANPNSETPVCCYCNQEILR